MRPLLPLILIAACSYQSRPADEAKEYDPGAKVMVHEKILDDVRLAAEPKARRLDDGRLAVRVVLVSDKKDALAVIAQTEWLDENGSLVETGPTASLVLPSATPVSYEESSHSAGVSGYRVHVRPASTKRRS
jgi:hypothetical protein